MLLVLALTTPDRIRLDLSVRSPSARPLACSGFTPALISICCVLPAAGITCWAVEDPAAPHCRQLAGVWGSPLCPCHVISTGRAPTYS